VRFLSWAGRLLRHPVLHFVVLGGLVYAWDGLVRGGPTLGGDPTIRIGAPEIEWLAANWQTQFGRAPTLEELRTVVDTYVSDEMRFRAGKELELDRGDDVVRRRIIQKYEFLFDPEAELGDPSEEQIAAHFAQFPDRFAAPRLFNFCHIYVASAGDRPGALARARALMEKLTPGLPRERWQQMGDPFPHEICYEQASDLDVRRHFGTFFADALPKLAAGQWSGPVESGYGFHAVKLDQVIPAKPQTLEAARTDVIADWRKQEIAKARAANDAKLKVRFPVVIDQAALSRRAGAGP